MDTSRITTNAGGVPFVRNIPACSVKTAIIESHRDYASVLELFPELNKADIEAVEQFFAQMG